MQKRGWQNPGFKKSNSVGILDDILRSGTGDRARSAEFGFGLADRYRIKPSFANPTQSPRSSPTSSQFTSNFDITQRSRSHLVHVPLVKSKSCPVDVNEMSKWTLDDPDAYAAANNALEPSWQCKGCTNTNMDLVKDGACFGCGAVDESFSMIDVVRQKNCPKNEDRTQVADSVPENTPQQLGMLAWAEGPESAADRRKRQLNAAGGTRVPASVLKHSDMQTAQNAVSNVAERDARLLYEGNGRVQNKARSILRYIESLFDQIPKLDKRIQRFVRMETTRILTLSCLHDDVCTSNQCGFSLSQMPNGLVGICIFQHCIEQLYTPPPNATNTIESLAPDVSKPELKQILKVLNDLVLANTNTGTVRRLRTASSIRIISTWTKNYVVRSLEACMPPPPAKLCTSASLLSSPEEFGRVTAPDPGDVTYKLRNCIISAATIVGPRPATRDLALASLANNELVAFMTKSTLPVDIIALALMASTAKKLKHQELTQSVVLDICRTNNVAIGQLEEFTTKLMPYISTEQDTDNELFF